MKNQIWTLSADKKRFYTNYIFGESVCLRVTLRRRGRGWLATHSVNCQPLTSDPFQTLFSTLSEAKTCDRTNVKALLEAIAKSEQDCWRQVEMSNEEAKTALRDAQHEEETAQGLGKALIALHPL